MLYRVCPYRLAWPRTSAFQAGNSGSNPDGGILRAFSSMAERSLDVRKAVGSIPTRRTI